jgi:hypothetical protein
MGYYEKDEWGKITGYCSDMEFDCEKCKLEKLFITYIKACGHPDCGYASSYKAKSKSE